MSNTKKIRRVVEKDHQQLVQFWQRAFPNDPPHNSPERVLNEKLKVDDLVFVCECDNRIVGACMAGYDGHRGWLYAVAVDSYVRRKGIGKELVKHVMSELKDLGCGKVNLQIRVDNVEVEAFYHSLGFATEPRLSMGIHL